MASYKLYYRNSFKEVKCVKCQEHEDSQKESYTCKSLFNGDGPRSKYEDIFEEDLSEDAIKDILHILNSRPQELKDLQKEKNKSKPSLVPGVTEEDFNEDDILFLVLLDEVTIITLGIRLYYVSILF